MTPKDREIVAFKDRAAFHKWLRKSFDSYTGIWMRIFKKDSAVETITYDQAVEEALCFGWIDGQRKSYDESSWIQKFTPRRSRSIWSKRNTVLVERLIEQGRMHPPGLKAVQEAKADGRWERAYASSKDMQIPEDFLLELRKHRKASVAFEALGKAERYSISFQLVNARTSETRKNRMNVILAKLAKAGAGKG